MLRTIIVDDERSAIDHLERLLVETKKIKVIRTYLDPSDALKDIHTIKPHVIFLDINMPEMTGIEFAERVIETNRGIKIVFVTAHDRYALKAFELGVVDYVLKPYNRERIEKIVNKLHDEIIPGHPQKYMINAFKYFHIKKDGKEVKNIKWRTSKGRELLAYLVQHGDGIVPKDVLIDLFWPNVNEKNAYDNLYSTIYQLRKTLDELGIPVKITNSAHGYEVDFDHVAYDVYEWEASVEEVSRYIEGKNHDITKIKQTYKKALDLYKGHFLEEEPHIWKGNIKEQYMIRFLVLSEQMIRLLRESGQSTEAILIGLHIQKLYPHLDYPYFILMQLYSDLGDRLRVEKHYHALKEMLENRFGVVPDKEIRDWYQKWISAQYSNSPMGRL